MFRRIPYPIAVVALHLLLLVPALPVAAVTGSPVDAHGVKPRDFGSRGTHEATTADAKATSPARAPVATSATSVSSLNTLANEKVCLAPGDQTNVQMLADGQGGAIIVWQDPRAGQWDIYAQRVDAFGIPHWGLNGVPVCKENGDQMNPRAVSDGSGGVIVVWDDGRGADKDIYAQRLSQAGAPQWTPGGVLMCGASQDQVEPEVTADGLGGAVMTWQDRRAIAEPFSQIYCQRINTRGALQWATDGVPVNLVTGVHGGLSMVSDGLGGMIMTWQDDRADVGDIYAQRIDEFGVFKWQGDGLPVYVGSGTQELPTAYSDGQGGVFVAWVDWRSGNRDIYAQRLEPLNGSRLWAFNGIPVCNAAGDQQLPTMTTDGASGVVVAWQDGRTPASGQKIYAQRLEPVNGAAQWAANGVAACTGGIKDQLAPAIANDPLGGTLLAWNDGRDVNNGNITDVYAQHLSASGGLQWGAAATQVCDAYFTQDQPQIVSDGSGGALVAWRDFRAISNADVYDQKVTSGATLPAGCTSQVIIPNASPVATSGTYSFFDWEMTDVNWGAVAVRSPAGTDLDLEVYDIGTFGQSLYPACYASPLAGSYTTEQVDLVVANCNAGHTNPSDPLEPGYGVRVTRFAGSGNGTVEWEQGAEVINPATNTTHSNWNHIVESWDIFLFAGHTYKFTYTHTGVAKITMMLFGSEGTTGTYVVPRSQRLFEVSDNNVYFLAPATEFYGLVFVNEDGQLGSYTVRFDDVGAPVGVGDGTGLRTALQRVSPNPSAGQVELVFSLQKPGSVVFDVVDMAGRQIARIPERHWGAGSWSVTWDGRKTQGTEAPPGVYFVQMHVDGRPVGISRLALLR